MLDSIANENNHLFDFEQQVSSRALMEPYGVYFHLRLYSSGIIYATSKIFSLLAVVVVGLEQSHDFEMDNNSQRLTNCITILTNDLHDNHLF